jgi:Asp-tRNA(Asn)/Glu-tRNA(Gln) amidotransferase A subunit family amidase
MTVANAFQPFLDGLQPQLMNLKIGVDIDHWQDTSVSIEVRTTFIEALEVLKTLGALITPIHLPELQNITEVASNIINFEAYQQLDLFYTHQRELMGAGLIQKLNSACKVVKEDYAQAQRQSEAFTQDLIHLFDSSNLERVDVIVSIGREAPAETMASLLTNPLGARSSCNRLYSLTGHPALTIPMGFASNGMPLAIQFAGHFHDEYLLYQVAHAFEAKIQCFKDRTDVPWMSV